MTTDNSRLRADREQKALGGIRSCTHHGCFLCGAPGITVYHRLRDRIFSAPGEWSLKECPAKDCGLVWLDPMPTEEDILVAYQDYYTHRGEGAPKPPSLRRRMSRFWDRCYLFRKYCSGAGVVPAWVWLLGLYRSLQPMKKAALDFNAMYLPVKPGGRLLEVGSGGGDNLRALQDIGWVVEGVDFDPEAVEAARRKGLHVRQGLLEEQRYPDEFFDAVTMSHLVEHVHDPLHLLLESRRVLKPGGRIAVVTPNVASIGHRLFSAAWLPLDPPRHLHLFSPQALSSLADRAGFQKKRVFTTIREAGNVFIASRHIKHSQRYVWGSVQPRLLKKAAKGMALMEWAYLFFSPLAGEELVLVAEK